MAAQDILDLIELLFKDSMGNVISPAGEAGPARQLRLAGPGVLDLGCSE